MQCDGMKWKCKICADGRLYNGAWIHESILPDPLPYNEIVFDEFPETINGGADYIWTGKELLYSPVEQSQQPEGEVADTK